MDPSEFRVVPRREIPDQWDQLVRDSPDGWLFGISAWSELVGRVPKWGLKDYGFGLIHGDSLVGVLPLHLDPASMRLVSTGWGGSGPILASWLSEKWRVRVAQEFLTRTKELATRVGAESITWEYPVVTNTILTNKGVPPLYDLDLTNQTVMHSVISLNKSTQDLWSGLSQTARQEIKKAKRNGYTVATESWSLNLRDYYEIHKQTYHRTGVNPHPREYFEGIAELGDAAGTHKLFVARDPNGSPIAFHNAAIFGQNGMYHTGCSIDTAVNVGVSHLMFWTAMNSLKDADVHHYDSGIVTPRQSSKSEKLHGISEFKRKFGGELHPSFRVSQSFDLGSSQEALPRKNRVSKASRIKIMNVLGKFDRG